MKFNLIPNCLTVYKDQKYTELKLNDDPLTTEEWAENFLCCIDNKPDKHPTTKTYSPVTYRVIAEVDRSDYDDDNPGYYALSQSSMISYAAMLTGLFNKHNIVTDFHIHKDSIISVITEADALVLKIIKDDFSAYAEELQTFLSEMYEFFPDETITHEEETE